MWYSDPFRLLADFSWDFLDHPDLLSHGSVYHQASQRLVFNSWLLKHRFSEIPPGFSWCMPWQKQGRQGLHHPSERNQESCNTKRSRTDSALDRTLRSSHVCHACSMHSGLAGGISLSIVSRPRDLAFLPGDGSRLLSYIGNTRGGGGPSGFQVEQ